MQKINKTNPVTWLAGGAALLSVEHADAAVVSVQLGSSYQLVDNNTMMPFSAEAGLAAQTNLTFSQYSGINYTSAVLINTIASTLVAADAINFGGTATTGGPLGTVGEPQNYGFAGTAVGVANEALRGLSEVSLRLANGGTVEGWLVVENTADVGVFSLTNFIFDNESLDDRDANEVATLAGFDNGDFATVDTVAAIPEPSSLALLALGAGGVMLRRKRKDVA